MNEQPKIESEPRDCILTTVALQPDHSTRIKNTGPLTWNEAKRLRSESLAKNPDDWAIIRDAEQGLPTAADGCNAAG